MTSVKKQLQEVVAALPDDCTMDNFCYRLHLRMKIEEGIQAIDEGRVYPHEEAVGIVRSWRESPSSNVPQGMLGLAAKNHGINTGDGIQ